MLTLTDCIVLQGPELQPFTCHRLTVDGKMIIELDLGDPCNELDRGAWVVIPGLCNSHTHMGDSCLPDGATGLTLEQGFFRPQGYKYQELAKQNESEHLDHIRNHLHYMARSGTIRHVDFREQGIYGCQLLKTASEQTGVESIVLGQFDQLPFSDAQIHINQDSLTAADLAELNEVLQIADGFSESTINDLTDPAWIQIREMTQKLGKLRAIHCLENEGYRDLSLQLTGRGDLIRALDLYDPNLVIHATVANEQEIGLLSQNHVNVVLNPRANANLGLPLPPIAQLLDSQANLLLGTDNGLLNSPNLFAELDFTYKVAKSQYGDAIHPQPHQILKMATSNIRPVLGGEHYGYIDLGLPADLVVLDFHAPHLRHTRHLLASIVTRVTPAEVVLTLRQGRILYQDSHFASEQLQQINSVDGGIDGI